VDLAYLRTEMVPIAEELFKMKNPVPMREKGI
jgi:hypothetical protein